MRTRFFLGALSPTLVLLLVGCGATVVANNGCQNTASSAPTINQGLVTIATNHASYATTGSIVATVTNKTDQPIFTYNHKASCTVLAIQQEVNGEWVAPSQFIAGCAQETPTGLVQLAPGKPYTASVHAGYLREVSWPAGTYRLALTYFSSSSDATKSRGMTTYSQPLTFVACGGTPAATSGSSATPQVTVQTGNPVTVPPQK
jgi:hypothetical protein